MLKTQARPAHLTSKLDRSVVDRSKFASNPTQQYLDVALARGSADLQESRTKINRQGKYSVKGLPEVDKKPAQKSSVPVSKNIGKGPVGGPGDKRVAGVARPEPSARSTYTSKSDPRKETTTTFKDKAKFENEKNQKLFQELDDMLAGKRSAASFPTPNKPKKETATSKSAPKRDRVNLVTKESLYPGISKTVKEKPVGSYKGAPVPPLQQAGSIAHESETWHARELRAKHRLQFLDKIDNFAQGNHTKRTKIFDDKPLDKTQTVGVPLHSVNTAGKRHIIADIPIFVPPYRGVKPDGQPVITNVQAIPVDRVYQNTIPNINNAVNDTSAGRLGHAPEGIVAPQLNGQIPFDSHKNQYTVYNDPVLERLQFEKAQKERAELEKENLKYFDTDPALDSTLPRSSYTSTGENNGRRDKTLMSDPGPGKSGQSISDGLEDLKYSPEGFLAEKRRQHRLEKETKMHHRYDEIQGHDKFRDNHGQSRYRDSYSYKYREHNEGNKPDDKHRVTDRENSWLRGSAGRPNERPYKKPETGYSGSTYRIPAEMDPRASSPEAGPSNYGRDTNRSYPSLARSRDKELYSDRNTYRSYDDDRDMRSSYDQDMQQKYAYHLARERETYDGDKPSYNDIGQDYRSRYKGSSHYPTGSEYPQDTGYKYSNTQSDKGPYSDRKSDREDDLAGYSKRTRDEKKITMENEADSGDEKSAQDRKKLQYVIRTKSGLSKSQRSQQSGPLPENIPPNATEMALRSDRSSRPDAKSSSTARDENSINPQTLPRQDPIGSEKTKATVAEGSETKKDTEKIARSAKETDDLSKYFDDAEDPNSEANKIPFYSDNVSRYARQKHEFRVGDIMTPVQESSMKQSEEEDLNVRDLNREEGKDGKVDQNIDSDKLDPYAREDRKDGKYVGRNPSNLLDNTTPKLDLLKKRYPSSTVNKHFIEEDRRSPWKKEEGDRSDNYNDKPEGPGLSALSKTRETKGESSVEQIKERIREKTLEKMKERGREMSLENLLRKSKEKTMDSQGPDLDDKQDLQSKVRDNPEDIEEGMEDGELYVCYLQTDNGDIIGPLKLDIDDVQIGLPKPLETQEDGEGKYNEIQEL